MTHFGLRTLGELGRVAVGRCGRTGLLLAAVLPAVPLAAQTTSSTPTLSNPAPQATGQQPGAVPPPGSVPPPLPNLSAPGGAPPVAAPLPPAASVAPTLAQPSAVTPDGGDSGGGSNVLTASDNDDAPLREGGGGIGFPGLGLNLAANVMGRYEDNLFRQQQSGGGFRLRPRVTVSYGTRLGQQRLFAQGTIGRDMFFGSGAPPDRQRYNASGGMQFQLSRCSGQIAGTWSRALIFLSDAVAFGGFEQESTGLSAGASCRIGTALSLNGGISRNATDSVRGVGRSFSVNSWNYSAGLTFASRTLGTFGVNGSISDSRNPGRLVLTPDGQQEDGLDQRSVGLSYQRSFGQRIGLSLGLNYINSQPKFDQTVVIVDGVAQVVPREGFSGLGYDAGLDFRLTQRLLVQLSGGRRTRVNPAVGAQFVVIDFYGIDLNYQFNRNYALNAGVSRRKNAFRGSFQSDIETVARRSDEFDRYYVRVSGQIGQRLTLGFDVVHNRRRSDVALFDFNSTGVGLSLGAQFGRGRS